MYSIWFNWKLEFYFWFLLWYADLFFLLRAIWKKKKTIKNELIDIDECLTNNGGCDSNAKCTNTIGSFNCTCKEGYLGDGITCSKKDQAIGIGVGVGVSVLALFLLVLLILFILRKNVIFFSKIHTKNPIIIIIIIIIIETEENGTRK